MNNLKDIKNQHTFQVKHDASIKETMSIMIKNKNGCAILIKKNKPIGILTESDIVNILKNKINLDTPVYKIGQKKVITVNQNRPIDIAFDILSKNNIRRIVLVNKKDEYTGVVTQENLFEYLEEDVYKVDLKINDIVKTNKKVLTIDVSSTIYDTLILMQEHRVGSIVVTKNNHQVGIITEKDILNITFKEINLKSNIEEYMNKPIITVNSNELVTNVIDIMKLKNIRRVVVLDKKNNVVNILTNRDILKHIKGNYSRILQNKIKHAQEIMNFLPEAIIEIFDNEKEQILYWMNNKAKTIFGDNLLDRKVTSIFGKKDWKKIYKSFQNKSILTNTIIKIGDSSYELSGTLSKNLNNNYIKIIFKDVTIHEKEKNLLQEEVDKEIKKRLDNEYLLMQQSKLAMMGEMIAHIAHQWRQPLSQLGGIFMNLEASYNFDELTKEYMNTRIKNGNELLKYMSTTIDDFSNFFEPNRKKEVFNASDYIDNAINIIDMSLTYNHINIKVNRKSEIYPILGYPSEFSQVILNILINAKDALCEKTSNYKNIEISIEKDKRNIIVQIEDNAGGIKEEIINKVFDMYFTTKKSKEGTGLGLYISRLIIETKLNGKIKIKNSKVGAKIIIEIPLSKKIKSE
ncbi:CBS domain-containing protein [Arcobacter sp. LA11]|uniref:CBS domain-containing protein n=1 Tax=Arcobacter sp. LA11 TaxID=1898176 RepID=UPI0009355A16|nr:CBS domain-containing protein [Arcobacter sp. LA11]